MILDQAFAAVIRFEIDAIRDDAPDFVRPVCRARNMITDAGLDRLNNNGNDFLSYAAQYRLGTSNTPTKRNTGAITLTRVGSTVTASASFFEAADAGRVLVAGDSGELRIASYVSATSITVSTTGADWSGRTGDVFYVTRTALGSPGPLVAFSEVAAGAGYNGYTWDAGTGKLTTWCTRVSGTAGADTTYKEICWQSASAEVLGIALINGGAGDTLLLGERYRVKLIVERTVAPFSPTASADLGVTGITGVYVSWALEGAQLDYWDCSGTIVRVGDGWATPSSMTQNCRLTASTVALPAAPVMADYAWTGTSLASVAGTYRTYTAGDFKRLCDYVFPSNSAAFSGVRSICFGGNTSMNREAFRGLLSAPIAKALEEKLTLTLQRRIMRVLS